jgi:hypothetical protein
LLNENIPPLMAERELGRFRHQQHRRAPHRRSG